MESAFHRVILIVAVDVREITRRTQEEESMNIFSAPKGGKNHDVDTLLALDESRTILGRLL